MLKAAFIIDEIVQYLSILKYYIGIENNLHNFNINNSSEDFFCKLLNLIYNLEFTNLNKLQTNFPAIDIADKNERICFQITSTSSLKKIRQTLDKFKHKELYKDYDSINILILGDKGRHKKNLEYKEFKFTYKDNLLDMNDLVKEISRKNVNELSIILEFFRNEFSFNIIEKIKDLEEDKSIYFNETIIEDGHICYYVYGLGKVRIDAYLPTSMDQQLSCGIIFQQLGLSDCTFTFNEEQTNSILFNDNDKGFSDKREFIWYINQDEVGIRFPNNRFITNLETGEQLVKVITGLYKSYSERKQKLYSIIGATYFVESNRGEFKIIRMPQNIWIAMVDFAQKHDYLNGDTKWNIFSPLNSLKKNHIIVYKNHLNKIKADIFVELHVRDLSGDYVDIIWMPGFTPFLNKMEGFDNIRKWKVDFTHEWILNEFVPYIIYQNVLDNRSMKDRVFKKKVEFGEFKRKFDYSAYNIESLSLKKL